MSRVILLLLVLGPWAVPLSTRADEPSHQATGFKIGEVTQDSAIVWVRLTEHSERNSDGVVRRGKPRMPSPTDAEVPKLEGAGPGMRGQVRIRYGHDRDLAKAAATDWVDVGPETDFSHQFRITGLEPGTRYFLATDTTGPGGTPVYASLTGEFGTAPVADADAKVLLTITTCQSYRDVDDPAGDHIYASMLALRPDFYSQTGDAVYLDSEDPRATSVALARYHWQRMYGLPRHVEFHRHVPGYWLKDDHDAYADDFWPGQKRPEMGSLTEQQAERVQREQVPLGDRPYRTVRWGRHLQIWLVEGRDFRSPNKIPDGPQKTIWGEKQKAWFKQTVEASDADWKLLISPTPLVGPDRDKKADNHSNATFAHEGNELRRWIADHGHGRLLVICGDRHWQYHSVDPVTGTQEFACGPASDAHAGGTPGFDPKYHKFHRVLGGFLSVEVVPAASGSDITLRHHDVLGKPVYTYHVAGGKNF
jgi:alkaline phosphatase D